MAMAINVVRTWSEEAALAIQRASESQSALQRLVTDADASDELVHAVGSGADFDDPFDAVITLARAGNDGMYDAWNGAEAAGSILERAAAKHPGGEGYTQLLRAAAQAEQAGGDLGNWIATGGRSASLGQLEAHVRPMLDEVRSAAEGALRAG
jgi:hypothetical protein